MIVLLAVAGCLLTLLICEKVTPLYASNAVVMIDPGEPKSTEPVDPMSFLPPSEESVRKNEIAMIRSRDVAEAVIQKLDLTQNPEFNPSLRPASTVDAALDRIHSLWRRLLVATGIIEPLPPKAYKSAAERVRDMAVNIFRQRLGIIEPEASRVIEIRFLATNPRLSAAIANAIAEEYIRQKSTQDVKDALKATSALAAEIRSTNQKIRSEDRAIEQMRNSKGGVPAADAKVIAEQISDLSRALIAAAAQRATDEARIAELNAARSSGNVQSFASVLASPLIQRLEEQAADRAAKLVSLTALYGTRYAPVRALQAELNGLRDRINAEVAKIASSYQTDLDTSRAREKSLQEMLAAAKAKMAEADESDVDVRALQREADANKSLMMQLAARLNDPPALIGGGRPNARIISAATVSVWPAYPPTRAMMAVALILFTTAGVILAILLERHDSSIRSTNQLRQMTTARVLGAIPRLTRTGRLSSPPALVLTERTSQFVENLRAVWFQIDHAAKAEAKTLLITSAVSREGKSSIAISLVRLLALSGRRVLLIDADLRYPVAHSVLGLKQAPGLAELIAGKQSLSAVRQFDKASGASVIAAGAFARSPADLLQSPALALIMAALSKEYDAIIIDSPPALAVHDAGILAKYADRTVVVVRSGTSAETFAAALQRLSDFEVPVSGVILSMADQSYPVSAAAARMMRKYYAGGPAA